MSISYASRRCFSIFVVPLGPKTLRGSSLPITHGVSRRSARPSVWSECKCVIKTCPRESTSSSENSPPQVGDKAAARRTTPTPASMRYETPFTTTAEAAPVRAGSGFGVPEPRIKTFVDTGLCQISRPNQPI